MAGLFESLLGDPGVQMGIGLLAAGGPSTTPMNVGQRVQMAMQGQSAQQQNALRMKLLQSQVDENDSQIALRKAQAVRANALADAPNSLFGWGGSPSSGGVPSNMGAGVQPGSLKGVPLAAVTRYKMMGGPDLTKQWELENIGTAQQPGWVVRADGSREFLGDPSKGLTVGPDGVTRPMTGAMESQAALAGANAGAVAQAQANFKPIKIFNPTTQREEFTSEGAVVNPMAGGRGNVQSSGYAGGDRNAANAESIRVIQSELAKPGNSPADTAAMQREIQRLQMQSGGPPSSNYAAGPSSTEAATAKANEARLVDTAKADVVRDTGKTAEGKRSAQVAQISGLAAQLLDQGPTASGIGSLVDSAANFVGQPLKSGTKAQQLEALSGWLVSNVPRMEGPQSNADVINYQTMAGRVGDRTLPVEARRAALGTLMELQRKYSEVGADSTAPAPTKPAKVLDTLPTANASNKGQRIRDTTTGKVLVSNGLQWKEE